ncbi:MAG: tetratricopeptide repeat protein [Ignavibacteria bacterium]|nr:tetratricopeptide repeat protein [Ignavibacteria bacterium]
MHKNESNKLQPDVDSEATLVEKIVELNNHTWELIQTSQFEDAQCKGEEAQLLAHKSNNTLQEGRAYNYLGTIARLRGNYQNSLEYYQKSLTLFEAIEDTNRISVVIGNIGIVYRNLSDYQMAIECYEKALKIAQDSGNKEEMARNTGNLGNIYLIMGLYTAALENYNRAIVIEDDLGNISRKAIHTGNIGSIYFHFKEYSLALEYYFNALNIHEQLGEKLGIAIQSGNIAGVHLSKKDYRAALEYYQNALDIYLSLDNKPGIAKLKNVIGFMNHNLGSFQDAMECFKQALTLYEEIRDKEGLAFTLLKIGTLYGEQEFEGYNPAQAEQYLLQAISLNGELGIKKEIYSCHETIAELYNQIGEGSKAYHHHKLFHDLENEVQSEEAKKRAEQFDYERKTAERDKQTAVERAKHEATEQLLHNVLPPTIAAKILDGTKLIAEKLDNVTVLFADIVGFTRLSQRVTPEELVQGLDTIFSEFDTLAEKHGLEKIKTIGDAYMVVSGAPIPREDHAQIMATMALEMVDSIRKFTSIKTDAPIEIRVGIHSGSVVAGVIGKKKFAYDLWGDAVNTASRMESHSLPGKIHVTEEFISACIEFDDSSDRNLQFTSRGKIEIKGKGIMNTYFLEQ